jgi:nucleoid-associated protein YgaU
MSIRATRLGRASAGVLGSDIAKDAYGDRNLWPRPFVANRDAIDDPDLIRVGQVLRVPFARS